MPKTKFQNVVFTAIMAIIMVYGMIVYNVALATGGVKNITFLLALHELPIMAPIAFVLEFFLVEKLAVRLAFTFMRPSDRPQFITYATSTMIVCIMCPVMSLIATLLFKEPSFGTWVQTFGCNLPMALLWQLLYCGPLCRLIFRVLFRKQLAADAEAAAAARAPFLLPELRILSGFTSHSARFFISYGDICGLPIAICDKLRYDVRVSYKTGGIDSGRHRR